MIVKNDTDITADPVEMDGAEKVNIKILIGPDDGSKNISMRHFTVLPGGNTPRHNHDYEHVVKIVKGPGIVLDEHGREHEVSTGQSVFIPANKEHQFRNPFSEPFEFLCIIRNL